MIELTDRIDDAIDDHVFLTFTGQREELIESGLMRADELPDEKSGEPYLAVSLDDESRMQAVKVVREPDGRLSVTLTEDVARVRDRRFRLLVAGLADGARPC